eukprot:6554193-Prymnesium_polylepis.1
MSVAAALDLGQPRIVFSQANFWQANSFSDFFAQILGWANIGSDVRARDQRKPRPQCPHRSMRTLDREESGIKSCSGRTPCRSGRRALRESAD